MTEATKEVGKAVQIGDWGGVRKSVGEYCRVGGLEALGVRVDGL